MSNNFDYDLIYYYKMIKSSSNNIRNKSNMLGLVLRVCVLGLMVGWGCGQDLGVKVDSGMESINTVANYTF